MIYGSSDRAIVIEPSSGAPVVREAIEDALPIFLLLRAV